MSISFYYNYVYEGEKAGREEWWEQWTFLPQGELTFNYNLSSSVPQQLFKYLDLHAVIQHVGAPIVLNTHGQTQV